MTAIGQGIRATAACMFALVGLVAVSVLGLVVYLVAPAPRVRARRDPPISGTPRAGAGPTRLSSTAPRW